MSDFLVPDLTEPIIAARAWNLGDRLPGGIRSLVGTYRKERWPRGTHTARCLKDGDSWGVYLFATGRVPVSPPTPPPHSNSPHAQCACGIYGVADPWNLIDIGGQGKRVWGTVEMWGQIVCGEKGWRAQYAQLHSIVQFTDSPRRCEREVSQTYDVPILTDWPTLTPPYPAPEKPKELPDGHRRDDDHDHGGTDPQDGAGQGAVTGGGSGDLAGTYPNPVFAPLLSRHKYKLWQFGGSA